MLKGLLNGRRRAKALAELTLDDEDYELLSGQRPMSDAEKRTYFFRDKQGKREHTIINTASRYSPESYAAWAARRDARRLDPAYREAERKRNRDAWRVKRAPLRKKKQAKKYKKKYRATLKGKELASKDMKKYRDTEKGREANRRYAKKYRSSEKGRAKRALRNKEYRAGLKARGLTTEGKPRKAKKGVTT